MIQFNLLPDVKLEYVKAQRTKHTVISAALFSAGTAFVIFLLLFVTVNVVQKKSLSDLNSDVKKYGNQLKSTPDLDKILTIQNQLGALPALHADKVAAGRSFSFIQQLTPATVSLSDVSTDYVANTMTITGQSINLDQVNTFIDTLKFTKYATTTTTDQPAFSGVVLSQFSRATSKTANGTVDGTTFTITLNFVPAIFVNASTVTLNVPNTVSTRSVVEQPTDIFKKATTK